MMTRFVESLSDAQLKQILEMFDVGSSSNAMSALFELLNVLESIAESRGINTDPSEK